MYAHYYCLPVLCGVPRETCARTFSWAYRRNNNHQTVHRQRSPKPEHPLLLLLHTPRRCMRARRTYPDGITGRATPNCKGVTLFRRTCARQQQKNHSYARILFMTNNNVCVCAILPGARRHVGRSDGRRRRCDGVRVCLSARTSFSGQGIFGHSGSIFAQLALLVFVRVCVCHAL